MNNKLIRKATTAALGAALVSSTVAVPAFVQPSKVHAITKTKAEDILAGLTPEQRQALASMPTSSETGILLDASVNLESDTPVSVIVSFKNKPAKAAVAESALQGKSLSPEQARSKAEADHAAFQKDLDKLFADKNAYKVKRTYKHAFNGVALEVPADKLKELVKSAAVQAIYSNAKVTAEQPAQDSGQGMADERSFLQVDKLHAEGYTGKGVKVAVLDTGVDYQHPDIHGAYKGGYDFVDNDDDPMETTYADWVKAGKPGNAANYVTEHGTHVAGTIAGQGKNESEYATTGIAPDAELYAYRVLGPGGTGETAGIIAAIDKAVADGMDVMNLSLGASYNDPLYPTSMAINNAVLSGVTAVVAAGNDGNKMYTLGSPGSASLALTVGASSVPITSMAAKGTLDNISADLRFMARGYEDDIAKLKGQTNTVVDVGLGDPAGYSGKDVKGKIVLISRGVYTMDSKIAYAKAKGAAIVLMYNDHAQEGHIPVYFGEGTGFVPAFSLTNADGLAFKQKLAAGAASFTFTDISNIKTEGDTLADFSSRGPSWVNYDIKPEITAPGVSVLSTVPGFINSPDNPGDYKHAYQRMSGTSMATPNVTGMAALLLQANPDLQPEDVKSILMNTADPLQKTYSVFEQGAGRVDPYEAVHASMEIRVKDRTAVLMNGKESTVKENTGSISFGSKAATGKDVKDSRIVEIENKGGEAKAFDVSVKFQSVSGAKDAAKNGVEVKTDASVQVGPHDKVSRNVSIVIPGTAETGVYEGYVVYTNHANPAETYQIPFGVHYVEQGFGEISLLRQSMPTDRTSLINPFFNPFLGATFSLKSHMRTIDIVLADAETGEDLGFVGKMDGIYFEEGISYFVAGFMGVYYPFTGNPEQPISDRSALAKDGRYTLKFIGRDDAGKAFTAAQDFFVDNVMPDQFGVQVEGEKADNPFVEYGDGQGSLKMTASIHDKAVDAMQAAGMKADQSKSAIWYFYNSPYPGGKLALDADGHAKDEIEMSPNTPVLNVQFEGLDQATNSYGRKQYFFVKNNTAYVYGQPNVKTRVNRVAAHIGDTITITLTANNVSKLKQANYSFTTKTEDTEIAGITLHPEAQKLGGKLNVTTTKLSGTAVKSNVDVVFADGVSGDLPMVDVTITIPKMQDPNPASSFRTVASTFTSVDNAVTKPFTYIAPIDILPDFTSVTSYIQAEGFKDAEGLMVRKDYTKVGAKVTVVDSRGKQYPGVMDDRGQYYATGLPLTRDLFSVIQEIPGHLTMHNTFTDAFKVMDGQLYGIYKRLGTETMRTAAGGDVNGDQVIDILDALAMQEKWGTSERSADINADGTVDAKDFAFIEKNFLLQNPTVADAPKPTEKYKGKTLAMIKSMLGMK
ncbi:S8 family serine peptidase [Ectobacillus ponti]|nr:S8 family serine peptidase [Ectobacillus ponti]